jgi:aldehyde:ferredoxin oxidoreductase
VLTQPLKGGKSDGRLVKPEELEFALNEYYRIAGWDTATGTPTKEKLAELGLEWIQ